MLKKIFLFGFLAVSVCVINAQQPSKEELQKQQRQLQKEIDDLNEANRSNAKNTKDALKKATLIQNKIKKREQLIGSINKDLRRLDDDIYAKQLDIYRLGKELDTLKKNYAQSIVFAYKNRSSYEYLNFLFSASNFNDALKRMAYLKSYRQYRETQAQAIVKTQELRQQNIAALTNSKTEQKTALQTQGNQLKNLEDDKHEMDATVKQLKDQQKEITARLRKTEKQRGDLNRAIDAAIKREIADAERKAKLAAANNPTVSNAPKTSNNNPSNRPSTSGSSATEGVATPHADKTLSIFESTPEGKEIGLNFENSKGNLPWPVSSGFVTYHYGKHEIPGVKGIVEIEEGILISLQVGSTVKCVATGEVMAITDLGDFQAVMVIHGKYITVYNKLASVSVSKGQKVSAGTVVGKSSQGFDGGGEVEFLVRNAATNRYEDPERWLKSK
jgi:septal ring factor EnvC (AmiA/AmiB activator)